MIIMIVQSEFTATETESIIVSSDIIQCATNSIGMPYAHTRHPLINWSCVLFFWPDQRCTLYGLSGGITLAYRHHNRILSRIHTYWNKLMNYN